MGLSRAQQLQLLQHQIASAALSGVEVQEIERRVIEPSNCLEDDKTALRLYAFSFLPRFDQRRLALDRLAEAQRQLGSARRRRVQRQRPERIVATEGAESIAGPRRRASPPEGPRT